MIFIPDILQVSNVFLCSQNWLYELYDITTYCYMSYMCSQNWLEFHFAVNDPMHQSMLRKIAYIIPIWSSYIAIICP